MNTSLAEITLCFDGATRGSNPGPGGAAAIIKVSDNADDDNRVSNRIGFVGNNCAEYYGLILGLRELIHTYPMMIYNLTIKGDSEVVMKQLTGEYRVRDDVLRNYYLVAKGLLKRISNQILEGKDDLGGKIRFAHVGRQENKEADSLAVTAAKMSMPQPSLRFFHYPCLNSFIHGIMGHFDS